MPARQETATINNLSEERENWRKRMFNAQQNLLAKWFALELHKTTEEYRKDLPDFKEFEISWERGGMPVIIDQRLRLDVILEKTKTVPNIDTTTTGDVVNIPKLPYVAQIVMDRASSFGEAEASLQENEGATALEGVLFRTFYSPAIRVPEYLFGSRTDGIHIPKIETTRNGSLELGIKLPIGKTSGEIHFIKVLQRK